MDKQHLEIIMAEVMEELAQAANRFDSFNNAHEGYAVILEELDELWDEIKANAPMKRQRKEAVQVAAMAVRFIYDLDTP